MYSIHPHGTGPWSEHNNNQKIRGAKRNPFEDSTPLREENTAIK